MKSERFSDATNPLYTGTRFPSSGLVEEAEAIYTELEFAGLLSSEAMRERLEEDGVGTRASHVEELAAEIEQIRDEILADELPETYRTERMHHVTVAEQSLSDAFPSVDAVVLGGFSRFDALERELLNRVVETWPTVALLPLQIDNNEPAGVDEGVEHALKTYLDLGFSREYYDEADSDPAEPRRCVTRNLYRHPDHSPDTDGITASSLGITVSEPETVPDEIRHIARDIRVQLSEGTAPSDVGVVLTSPIQYADIVTELFETYGLPFQLDAETPLSETALGDAVATMCQLSREPRTVDSLLHLLTNPLISLDHQGERLDHRELTHVASRVETNSLETTLDHADDAVEATITALIENVSALTDTSLDDLPDSLESLLEELDVPSALSGDQNLNATLQSREQRAWDRLERVLETLAMTEPVADSVVGDSVERLERALHNVSIRGSSAVDDERVQVCGLREAQTRSFEEVYVVGLTSSHVPSEPEQTAFARPIREAHPDFEQRDVAAESRSHIGALFGSDAKLNLSIPQRGLGGDPYVEADLITELRRVVDMSSLTEDTEPSLPGCEEDIQQDIGRVIGDSSVADGRRLLQQAKDDGTFDDDQVDRLERGISCGDARSSPELTPYDGQLSPEMVERVYQTSDREPYSPSRLETYATCGFKYYMKNVLDIDAPDPLTREPDAGDRGSYLHDVFEHYYKLLQSTDGEPISPGGNFEARQQHLLTVALDRLDRAFDDHGETSFQAEWLTQVLAGLGTSDENPYYGPDEETAADKPVARGLLYRFLEHEFDEPARTTARPTWFEAKIGNPHSGGTQIQTQAANIETPNGMVSTHGLIDRVETVPGTNPTQLVVRDYKTGNSTPSESDVLLGTDFQLPLYALMAEDALDDVETVGGAYYQVSPPTSVSSRKGLFTSQDMAVYYRSDDVSTPLLRHSYPAFETHADFREFIEETTQRRLGTMAEAIEHGGFHPTVLDPDDAGCRYCDYAHVCDVRSHLRQDTIGKIDETDVDAYVPPRARGQEVEDMVGGE